MFWMVWINNCTLLIFTKRLSQGNSLTACLIWSILARPPIHKKGYNEFWLNFANVVWWWQFACSEEWTPNSITKICLSCPNQVYTRGGVTDNVWGFFNYLLHSKLGGHAITFGVFIYSYVVIVPETRFCIKIIKNDKRKIFATTKSRFNSRLLINDSKPFWHLWWMLHRM